MKHIVRYLCRYPDLELLFEQGEENCLHGYTDANYSQVVDDNISIGGHIFFLGRTPISWNSIIQSSTSRSLYESEYKSMSVKLFGLEHYYNNLDS